METSFDGANIDKQTMCKMRQEQKYRLRIGIPPADVWIIKRDSKRLLTIQCVYFACVILGVFALYWLNIQHDVITNYVFVACLLPILHVWWRR